MYGVSPGSHPLLSGEGPAEVQAISWGPNTCLVLGIFHLLFREGSLVQILGFLPQTYFLKLGFEGIYLSLHPIFPMDTEPQEQPPQSTLGEIICKSCGSTSF